MSRNTRRIASAGVALAASAALAVPTTGLASATTLSGSLGSAASAFGSLGPTALLDVTQLRGETGIPNGQVSIILSQFSAESVNADRFPDEFCRAVVVHSTDAADVTADEIANGQVDDLIEDKTGESVVTANTTAPAGQSDRIILDVNWRPGTDESWADGDYSVLTSCWSEDGSAVIDAADGPSASFTRDNGAVTVDGAGPLNSLDTVFFGD